MADDIPFLVKGQVVAAKPGLVADNAVIEDTGGLSGDFVVRVTNTFGAVFRNTVQVAGVEEIIYGLAAFITESGQLSEAFECKKVIKRSESMNLAISPDLEILAKIRRRKHSSTNRDLSKMTTPNELSTSHAKDYEPHHLGIQIYLQISEIVDKQPVVVSR